MKGNSNRVFANSYSYDQLNRLTKVRVYNGNSVVSGNSWDGATHTENYGENLSYDKNGNILTLKRNAHLGSDANYTGMDNLTYRYENGTTTGTHIGAPLYTNKLLAVQDATTNTDLTTDLQPGQQDDNYAYDDIGNLISDVQEEIENIEWTVYGKVKSIKRIAGSDKYDLEFGYDPAGNRIRKTVIKPGTGTEFGRTTNYYYLRDAQGNIMATYSLIGTETGNEVERTLAIDESSIYGSSRLGTLKREQWIARNAYDLTSGTPVATGYSTYVPDPNVKDQFRGDKNYELANHLGNVLAVVSDLRTPEYTLGNFTRFNAKVNSAQDYFSFGMLQNGRTYNSNSYKYDFNGKIKDDEWNGNTGATYDYGFRIYDTRIGRFLSLDPKGKDYPWYTPFQYSGNSPIANIDVDGLEPSSIIDNKGRVTKPIIGFVTGALNIDVQVSYKTTWLHGEGHLVWEADKPGAITMGANVYYSPNWAKKYMMSMGDLSEDERNWIGLVAHEHTHRSHIDMTGSAGFYLSYLAEYVNNRLEKDMSHYDAYKNITTEIIAYRNEEIINSYLKNNSQKIFNVMESHMSDEFKELKLKHIGLTEVYIPTLEKNIKMLFEIRNNTTDKKAYESITNMIKNAFSNLDNAQTKKAVIEEKLELYEK